MIIPEREKGVKSFRIPRVMFRAVVFFSVITLVIVGILAYDYSKLINQVYKNKHLTIENRQLKEQIVLFDRKLNSLTEDIKRIHIFEKKLRVITGLEEHESQKRKSKNLLPGDPLKNKNGTLNQNVIHSEGSRPSHRETSSTQSSFPQLDQFSNLSNKEKFAQQEDFLELKDLYEKKIATSFGLHTGYRYTKEWSQLTKSSFSLASQFALFDHSFNIMKDFIKDIEVKVHQLDQHLLDQDSFLKSTPTLLPTKGWITSYYGPRKSHYSGRIKMHEGLDIGAKPGTQIIAPADGIVTFSGKKPGFGFIVQIDHGYGVETIYAHASKLEVNKSQSVKRGMIIARVGNTGLSTGPHVHYEVRVNGTPVDPLYYVLD
jgi:murein DD-endopeptidase MepM/ murein hydrolase activator NlpD